MPKTKRTSATTKRKPRVARASSPRAVQTLAYAAARAELEKMGVEWIHSTLDYVSPIEFELKARVEMIAA